jgi:dTDP-glucose 4,6-dehydratase
MRTLLVTGAAGFIGSNFVRLLCGRGHDGGALAGNAGGEPLRLVCLDKLTYAGNLANIADLIDGRHVHFVKGDICDAALLADLWKRLEISHVVHFAAESHVDRSIMDSGPFIQTNVVGTQVLLDTARRLGCERFVQVSTDEVYGSLPEHDRSIRFTEETPLAPNSPYAASKAAADCLVRSYFHTFGMPVLITRCSNNYGPWHFPEKMIPLFVTNLLEGRKVPLYGDGLNIRDWLYVEDHCQAVWTVLNHGRPGEVYNIGGNNELTNRQVTEIILREMGLEWDDWVQYVKDRPGHDRRYAMDASKITRELGWQPQHTFQTAIRRTIQWYRDHTAWWQAVKTGEYLQYYQRQYGDQAAPAGQGDTRSA